MTSREERLQELCRLCGELDDDDGREPRFDRRDGSRRKNHKKDRQLCSQVRRSLELTLAGSPDNRLRGIEVLAVEPAPDASHLLVLVVAGAGDPPVSEAEATAALRAAAGVLRREVTTAIHRRRSPELTYRFVPGGSGEGAPPLDPDDEDDTERGDA